MPKPTLNVAYATKNATISDTAKSINHEDWAWSSDDLDNAERAFVTPIGAGIMLAWSGVVPTASLGHKVGDGETLVVVGNANVQALKMIREDSDNAVVTITLEN